MHTEERVWAVFTLVKEDATGGRDFEDLGGVWLWHLPRVGDYVDFRNSILDDGDSLIVREVNWKLPKVNFDQGFAYQTAEVFVGIPT